MTTKEIKKEIGRFIGYVILNTCSLAVRILPPRFLYKFANSVAKLGYVFAGKQRKIALEGLEIAFGAEKTESQRLSIAKECFYRIAKSGVELLYLMDKPKILKERVTIEGKEHLDAALAPGRGAILVSAHFGNFPLMLGGLSMHRYKVSGIMRLMRDPRTEKFFLSKRKKFNVGTIYSQPRKECVEQTIRALRDNELVFIPLDQNFGTAGVFVNFFGKQAATATGPVIFAQRTKAALLPCFIIRQKDDTHKIEFAPAVNMIEGADAKETIVLNIQLLTNIIESYIRKYPEEWGWIHRRWKSQESK